jgi:hypothetical protein
MKAIGVVVDRNPLDFARNKEAKRQQAGPDQRTRPTGASTCNPSRRVRSLRARGDLGQRKTGTATVRIRGQPATTTGSTLPGHLSSLSSKRTGQRGAGYPSPARKPTGTNPGGKFHSQRDSLYQIPTGQDSAVLGKPSANRTSGLRARELCGAT